MTSEDRSTRLKQLIFEVYDRGNVSTEEGAEILEMALADFVEDFNSWSNADQINIYLLVLTTQGEQIMSKFVATISFEDFELTTQGSGDTVAARAKLRSVFPGAVNVSVVSFEYGAADNGVDIETG